MHTGVVAIVALTGLITAQAQQAPTFRSNTDLVRLEVSVLDKYRNPIRGLTAADFTVQVDGVNLPVVAVEEVDEMARGTRAPTGDITSNAVEGARLFVVIMDDVLAPLDPFVLQNARRAAETFVRGLLAGDFVSVVYSWEIQKGQEFTTDHARALAAIDRFRPGPVGHLDAARISRNTLAGVMQTLQNIPAHRRAVLWVSRGFPPEKDEGSGFGVFGRDGDFGFSAAQEL